MFNRIFKRDEAFFDLLEASAEEARNCAAHLKDVIAHLGGDTSAQLEAIQQSRRKHKKLTQGLTERLCKTFVTPLDREDIEALNSALNKVPKTVEKIAERLAVCPVKFTSDIVVKQCSLLDQATVEVVGMVGALRKKAGLEKIQDMQDRLQHIEGDGDKMLMDLLRQLYNGRVEAIEVIILKDLYELLERQIERCRDPGSRGFPGVMQFSSAARP
jgi:uncharacterized protein Yka (UPF0111/DUF47 family)